LIAETISSTITNSSGLLPIVTNGFLPLDIALGILVIDRAS
jgi:hypothetical protein